MLLASLATNIAKPPKKNKKTTKTPPQKPTIGALKYLLETQKMTFKKGSIGLLVASANGNEEGLLYLLDNNILNITDKKDKKDNPDENTELHVAIENSQLKIINFLLGTYNMDLKKENKYGHNAFFTAIKTNFQLFRYLREGTKTEHQETLELQFHQDKEGKNLMEFVVANGNINIFKKLQKYGPKNGGIRYPEKNKGIPLSFWAIHTEKKDMFQYIIDNIAGINNKEKNIDLKKNNPLLFAIEKKKHAMINHILHHTNIDVAYKNEEGTNAGMLMIQKKNIKGMQTLYKTNPKKMTDILLITRNKKEQRGMNMALDSEDNEIIKALFGIVVDIQVNLTHRYMLEAFHTFRDNPNKFNQCCRCCLQNENVNRIENETTLLDCVYDKLKKATTQKIYNEWDLVWKKLKNKGAKLNKHTRGSWISNEMTELPKPVCKFKKN